MGRLRRPGWDNRTSFTYPKMRPRPRVEAGGACLEVQGCITTLHRTPLRLIGFMFEMRRWGSKPVGRPTSGSVCASHYLQQILRRRVRGLLQF